MKRILPLLATLLLGACEKPDPSSPQAQKSAAPQGTIGVSLLTLDNPFFKVIGDAISKEGAKQGYQSLVVSGDKDVEIGRAHV